MKWVFSVLGNG